MDQDAFRDTYQRINQNACLYEKSLLTNRCNCSQARRFCIAEREGVECRSQLGHQQCQAFLQRLREQGRFTLRQGPQDALAHGKAMRLQVGGLRWLRQLLCPGEALASCEADVFDLLQQAVQRFGSLEQIPLAGLIQAMAAYRPPTRKSARKS